MNIGTDLDQFQVLEDKVDALIQLVSALKREKASLAERLQIQEERLMNLTQELETLRSARDKAKQKIFQLLERIEQVEA
jgi:uncharacterized coiled-coil DUF342 family protein